MRRTESNVWGSTCFERELVSNSDTKGELRHLQFHQPFHSCVLCVCMCACMCLRLCVDPIWYCVMVVPPKAVRDPAIFL
jgi:hypothetical protein